MHQRAPRLLAPPTVQAVVAPEGSRFGRARKRAREEGPAREDTAPARSASTLAVSLVCACNMNRSMSAHVLLEGAGYRLLSSYGTSDAVRLPHRRGPIAFQWGGSGYADMEDEMSRTYPDQVWMQVTGIAGMLQRNARLKARPESWYAQEDEDVRRHDVVVVFDAYAYQQVILDMEARLTERKEAEELAAALEEDEQATEASSAAPLAPEADAQPAAAPSATPSTAGALTVDTLARTPAPAPEASKSDLGDSAVAAAESSSGAALPTGSAAAEGAPPAGTPTGPTRARARCEGAAAPATRPVAVLLLPTRDNIKDAEVAAGHCLTFVDAVDAALRKLYRGEAAPAETRSSREEEEEAAGLFDAASPASARPAKLRRVSAEQGEGVASGSVVPALDVLAPATPQPEAPAPGAVAEPRLRPRTCEDLALCVKAGLSALEAILGTAAITGAEFKVFDF